MSNIFIADEKLRQKFVRAVDQAGYSQVNLMGLVGCQAAYGEGEEWLLQLKEYLYQNNMKIPMPVILSSRQYAILFDAGCMFTYEEKAGKMTFTFDAVDDFTYYCDQRRLHG